MDEDMDIVPASETVPTSPGDHRPVLVLGGGPAGLAATEALISAGNAVILLERAPELGGMCRSIRVGDQCADLGNHVLSTREACVRTLVERLYPDTPRQFPHSSGMLFKGRLVPYPIPPKEAVQAFGVGFLLRVLASLVTSRLSRSGPFTTYEDLLRNRYGSALYEGFFAPYLTKTWGTSPAGLRPETQSGRSETIWRSLASILSSRHAAPTMFFDLPNGNGDLYTRWAEDLRRRGADIRLNTSVGPIGHDGRRITTVEARGQGGDTVQITPSAIISTIPLQALMAAITPPLPVSLPDADMPQFRDIVLVYQQFRQTQPLSYRTIYIADPSISAIRMTEYSNLYGNMAQPGDPCLRSAEYWVPEGAAQTEAPDEEWLATFRQDMTRMPFPVGKPAGAHRVIRLRKAAPVPKLGCSDPIERLRQDVSGFSNLHLVGRAGRISYLDQDKVIADCLARVGGLALRR